MKRKDKVLLYHQIIHTVYWTAQCLPSASPHQWNLQNRGGKRKKKGEDMMQYITAPYVTIELCKNCLHFKAGYLHYTLYPPVQFKHPPASLEWRSSQKDSAAQDIKDKPPFCSSHVTVKVCFCNLYSELFALRSLTRLKSRNASFFHAISIAKTSLNKTEVSQKAPPLP